MLITRRNALQYFAAAAGTAALAHPAIAQSGTKVVIAQPTQGFIYIPLYIARRLGFFAQEGLDVEVIVFQKGASEALTALLTRQVDICVANPGIQLRAQEKGQPIKSFAAVQTQFGTDLVISANAAERIGLAKLTDPKARAASLKGLTIATSGPGSLADLMTRHIARYGGLDPDRDLTITPVGGAANMLAAFGQKRIDGYGLSAPTSTAGVVRFGGSFLFDFARGEYPPFKDFLFYALVARDDWMKERRDVAEKVVRGLWRGLQVLKSNPDEARAAVQSFFQDTPQAEFDMAWAQNLPGFPSTPRIEANAMEQNFRFLSDGEGRPVTVPLSASYTNEIVDAVAKGFR